MNPIENGSTTKLVVFSSLLSEMITSLIFRDLYLIVGTMGYPIDSYRSAVLKYYHLWSLRKMSWGKPLNNRQLFT